MKRFFPVILSLILLCSMLFTGCSTGDKTALSSKDMLNVNFDLLTDNLTGETVPADFADFSSVVSEWAKENNINIAVADDKSIILTKEHCGELKNVEDFAFHTSVDFSSDNSTENSLSSAAVIMTLLNSSEAHGQLAGIFTLFEENQPSGAESIDDAYLEYDNFIDITYSEKNTVLYNTFAASSDLTAVKNLNITKPVYTKAYTIEFHGIENQSAYKNRGTYPNPIKTIGDLLASSQTSTILFELADFNGGTSSDEIPSDASATIVLHENDVDSFTKKFENSYEKIADAYEDVEEGIEFEYTLTPAELPQEVISKDDTENIVSLMYTMINGTYLRNDNDEVEAYSNIGKVSTSDNRFELSINAKSLSNETMDEIKSVVKTICGLSDIDFESGTTMSLWTNNSENPLVSTLSSSFNTEGTGILEMKHITAFIEKNDNINLISWGTNIKDSEKNIDKLLEYMAIAGTDLKTDN